MRTEEAMEGWRLSGRIPGAGQEDAAQEDIRLPFALEHFENLASREGMFLRAWELSREISRPQDPPHSRAERVLLTLDGVCGQGVLYLNANLRALSASVFRGTRTRFAGGGFGNVRARA